MAPAKRSFPVIFSLLTGLFLSSVSGVTQAIDFDYGELFGSLDTTVSYGQNYRVQSRDSDLIGIANGGNAFSVNGDDGNLNYDTGLISSTLKFTTELELNYRNFGAFIRGTGFRDFLNDDSRHTERTPLDKEAIELVGEDLKLLDAYVWAGFDIGSIPVDIRLGEQVISWGESTFIQNSINTINPVDVSKLRVPGAELKEALVPVGIVSVAAGLTDTISAEVFYQYDYERVLIDPPGSYFSTNDFVGNYGQCAVLGFGFVPDRPLIGIGDATTTTCDFVGTSALAAPRVPDDRPEEGGQYGASLHWYSEALNDTEFGFYYINYHSRLPVINAFQVTAFLPGPTPDFSTGAYQIGYPEDIQLFGVSFNTQLGTTGWALQGEYSFRHDAPLQIDDAELLLAAAGGPNQLGVTFDGSGQFIQGFIERDVSQVQMTATKIFGPTFKADQAVFLTEFAVTHVHDMPDKDTLRLEAPGTSRPGPFMGIDRTAPLFIGSESNDDFADATSWGYRVVGRLDYNNLIGAINVSPRFSWRHDVSGITPGPGGNFIEGNKAITLGVAASYLNKWEADFSYTNFFGAGSQNLLNDRDFLAFSLSYSF